MRQPRLTTIVLAAALALAACGKKAEPDPADRLMEQSAAANEAARKMASQTVERLMNPSAAPALPQPPHQPQRKSTADLSTPLEKYVFLNRQDDRQRDYVFLYVALGGELRGGHEELLNLTSAKYFSERDGFRKKEIAAAETPRIAAEVERHKSMRYIAFEGIAITLTPYDFDKKGFSYTTFLSCKDSSWGTKSGIGIRGYNSEGSCMGFDSMLIPQDLETAKTVEALRAQGREQHRVYIYAYAEGAANGSILVTPVAMRVQVFDVKDVISRGSMDNAQLVADLIARRAP